MLTRFGRWARPRLAAPVWSSGVGLARTLLALGTLGTLLATDPAVLMSPLSNGVVPPICQGAGRAGIWCVTPDLAVGRWLSVALLLLVISGWRPRITALGHWYVSWSLIANATIQDGGDQITAVLTLLLVPICLTDRRRWHWQDPVPALLAAPGPSDTPQPSTVPESSVAPEPAAAPGVGRIVARIALLLIQIQVAVLYFQASVAKLGVTEWANGTAMYYWSRHPSYGSPPWLRPVTDLVTHSPVGVAAITWGSLVLEFALALAIVLRPVFRRPLLVAGLTFHGLIALDMGLVSFWAAMSGALLLYLLPVGHQIDWPRRLARRAVRVVRRPVPSPPARRPAGSAPVVPVPAGSAPVVPVPSGAVPVPSGAAPDRHVFVYDGDCGFCARSVRHLRRLLRPAARDTVQFVPWQSGDLAGWGLSVREVDRAAYLILADGTRLAGAAAFSHLLAGQGRGWWSRIGRVARTAPTCWLARGIYRLVAANRHRLPGGTAACATATR